MASVSKKGQFLCGMLLAFDFAEANGFFRGMMRTLTSPCSLSQQIHFVPVTRQYRLAAAILHASLTSSPAVAACCRLHDASRSCIELRMWCSALYLQVTAKKDLKGIRDGKLICVGLVVELSYQAIAPLFIPPAE